MGSKSRDCSLAFLENLKNAGIYEAEGLPMTSGEAVRVMTSVLVISMDDLDLTQMDFGIDFYLLHNWKDQRLKHPCLEDVIVPSDIHEKIWTPDTYIVNAKDSTFHRVALQNKQIKIRKDGYVQLSLKLTARVSCPLDLHSFPWDVQHCSLVLESYAYSNKDIIYVWGEDLSNQATCSNNLPQLSQYSLANFECKKKLSKYAIGNWSTLEMKFAFKRNSAFYVYQVMGPTILTVCLSWVSFFIKHDQHPARISLGITSVLTMEAIQLFVQTSLPKIHYMTMLDSYSIGSHIFVYLAMAEYAVVLLLFEKGKKMSKHNLEEKAKDDCIEDITKEGINKKEDVSEQEGISNEEGASIEKEVNKDECGIKEDDIKEEDKIKEKKETGLRSISCCSTFARFQKELNTAGSRTRRGEEVDLISRFVFPLSFVFFNITFYCYITFILPAE